MLTLHEIIDSEFLNCNLSSIDFNVTKMKNVMMYNCVVFDYYEKIEGLTLIDCNIFNS